MELLDGKIVSQAVKEDLTLKIMELQKSGNRIPHLAAILIGENGASETYIAIKIKNCAEVGIKSSIVRFEENSSESTVIEAITKMNNDDHIDGILVQLPLPQQIDEQKIINLINPAKDVDGFHPINTGKLIQGIPTFIPATPYGIMLMLEHYNINTSGKHAVIIGRSNIVGRPMSILLSQNSRYGNCTVTVCHSRTINLKEICLQADIIVAALGQPGFLTGDMIKENAIVIDVGINKVKDEQKKSGFSIRGDVAFDEAAAKCSYITPVPGGVGLMTIAALLKNTYNAYLQRKQF
jgi:methylenetetrahydrofolate dehydrogenase (NADP+)/methenyltetrahydrofolate cyclohydrolase